MTITKIENLHIAHVEKFNDSKSAILFDLGRKITTVSQLSEQWRHQALVDAWPS